MMKYIGELSQLINFGFKDEGSHYAKHEWTGLETIVHITISMDNRYINISMTDPEDVNIAFNLLFDLIAKGLIINET